MRAAASPDRPRVAVAPTQRVGLFVPRIKGVALSVCVSAQCTACSVALRDKKTLADSTCADLSGELTCDFEISILFCQILHYRFFSLF